MAEEVIPFVTRKYTRKPKRRRPKRRRPTT